MPYYSVLIIAMFGKSCLTMIKELYRYIVYILFLWIYSKSIISCHVLIIELPYHNMFNIMALQKSCLTIFCLMFLIFNLFTVSAVDIQYIAVTLIYWWIYNIRLFNLYLDMQSFTSSYLQSYTSLVINLWMRWDQW